MAVVSNAGSKKSIWPGKSHTWKSMNELQYRKTVSVKSTRPVFHFRPTGRGKRAYWILSLLILEVLSRNSVSVGDILWNTTRWMLDLPLLSIQMRE